MFKNLPAFLITVFVFLLLPSSVAAATLYLSPSKASVGQGQTRTIQVRLSTGGDQVNAVSASISYPADKVDVTYVTAGSAFSVQAVQSYGGGGVRIERGSFGPVSGDILVATIGIRGKSTGTASFGMSGSAPRFADASNSVSSTGGATITVGAATQTDTSKTGESTKTESKPNQIDTTAPKISNLKVEKVSSSSAAISWKTDEKADSVFEYGLEKGRYFLTVLDRSFSTDHIVNFKNPIILPGQKIFFKVYSKDQSGNQSESQEGFFQLNGYKIKIKVLNELGQPLANTTVVLYSEPVTAKTNAFGEVEFENVTPEKHLVVVKDNKSEKTSEIKVEEKEGQSFEVKLETNRQSSTFSLLSFDPIYVLVVISLLVIASSMVLVGIKKLKNK